MKKLMRLFNHKALAICIMCLFIIGLTSSFNISAKTIYSDGAILKEVNGLLEKDDSITDITIKKSLNKDEISGKFKTSGSMSIS